MVLTVGPAWRVYTVPLALAPGDPLEFVLRSATFGASDRQLGVQISAARWRRRGNYTKAVAPFRGITMAYG